MPALNPITHANPTILAAALALDPATRAEERLQSLLWLWLSRYFSGTAFTTRAIGGGTEQRTFSACTVDFQESSLPENPQIPILHVIFPERKSSRRDYTAGTRGKDDDWTVSLFVKVPATLAATAIPGNQSDIIAKQKAGELEWLLESSEREALTEQGITRIELASPSTIIPSDAWSVRMLVLTCRTRREMARRAS